MGLEDEKYKRLLPPLSLLPDSKTKELKLKLKELSFLHEKNKAA